jgi:cysteine synthase A
MAKIYDDIVRNDRQHAARASQSHCGRPRRPRRTSCSSSSSSIRSQQRQGPHRRRDDRRRAQIGPHQPGGTVLIEPTSGNTGIALAFVAAAKGLKLVLTMPETMSIERRKLLKVLGARLVLTEGPKGHEGRHRQGRGAQQADSQQRHSPAVRQPVQPGDPPPTTAEEIWRDTDGKVDIVVSGIGTGGTITGVGEVLKSRKPSASRSSRSSPTPRPCSPAASPARTSCRASGRLCARGAQHEDLRRDHPREGGRLRPRVETGEPARRHSDRHLVGRGDLGRAAARQAPENKGKQIVVIIPSSSERYLSTWLFADINVESDSIDDLGAGRPRMPPGRRRRSRGP